MSAVVPEERSFLEVKASVGSVLFLCSRLERELRQSVMTICGDENPQTRCGLGPMLRMWQSLQRPQFEADAHGDLVRRFTSDLQGPIDMRDALCHGLVGMSREIAGHPQWVGLTVEFKGETRVCSGAEIEAICSRLDRLCLLVEDFTDAVLATDAAKVRACHGAIRSWWPT